MEFFVILDEGFENMHELLVKQEILVYSFAHQARIAPISPPAINPHPPKPLVTLGF
jgi:hypothetical protein